MSYLKNPSFILILIVIAFLFREVFLAGVFPLFTGQDESRHYNTVQWLTQKQDMRCLQTDPNNLTQDKNNLATYRFSEEIRETSAAAGLSVWREENYRKPAYANGSTGANEALIQEQRWGRDTIVCPPDIVSTAAKFSFFHWMASGIERAWGETDILTRFYLIRILAVILGTITILLAYYAAVEAGLTHRVGLLIALILSFQPRLSIYTTNINYDALLLPFFALFLWAGLRCLRRGFSPVNIALLGLSFGGAILTKGTGLVLLGGVFFLAGFLIFKKRASWKQIPIYHWIIGGVLLVGIALILNNTYTFSRLLPELSPSSLFEYLKKSVPRIPSSSENFWGTFSWNEATFGPYFVWAIWLIEALALFGLIRYLYLRESLPHLPAKSVILFCLTLVLSLQLGVRFHDWHVFQETGKLLLGTPGRYFLPTILSQLILVAAGLGALFRKNLLLERILMALALIMLTFYLYTIWLIIIPRFYL